MAVVEMQKISICAHRSNRKAILETLQSLGMMQMSLDALDDSELTKMDTADARARFEKNADLADQAVAVLDRYVPEHKGILAGFAGKELIDKSDYARVIDAQTDIMGVARDILRNEKAISECNGNILRDENQIEALAPWMNLDVPMSFTGTKKTAAFIGTVSGVCDDAALYAQIREKAPEADALSVSVLSSENDSTNVFVLCLKEDSETVEGALRAAGFARPSQAVVGVPSKEADRCREDIEKQKAEIAKNEEEIKAVSSSREDLRVVADYYRTRAEKYRLLGTIPQSGQAFFLEGWVPADSADRVAKLLADRYGAVVEKEEKQEEEVEPTLLHNNKYSRNYEPVLASYGLPKHGKVDPTFLMSIFYVFFFGMMLSDAGYGLMMAIGCFIVLKKCPRMGEGMKKMLTMFMWCGVSTTFWGVMFGGFFGDVVDVVAKTFFGYAGEEAIIKPLWFNPLNQPMRLLIWCMLFGLIHLFTGLGIKGYEYLKEGDIVGFVSDIVAWYAFLIGLILILLPTDLFQNIAQMEFNFPAFVAPMAKVLTFAGMIVIILMSGRANKNWGLRIALGAYDIYGVTSWLSDVLSYSRLLALGLATGVIAQVINTMGSMFGGGPIGAILFIIIFLVGTVLNFAINALGAYVHTNRLQYVEFFGK
ncbi:MAG: V-type ATP synthase subunit I, partial [Lachnospiraceae bacterium]|nr:V-type ATP synthase subunit I [Lachnospiraceae bacterium]